MTRSSSDESQDIRPEEDPQRKRGLRDTSSSSLLLPDLIKRNQSKFSGENMPEDLQNLAVERLRILLLVFGAIHALFLIAIPIGPEYFGGGSWACSCVGLVLHAVGLLVSLLFAAAIRRTHWSAERILNLGLSYQVLTCLAVAYAEQGRAPAGISLVAVLILIFPLFLTRTMRRTLIASLLSAAMAPLAFYIYQLSSGEMLPVTQANYFQFGGNFLFAGLTFIPCRIVSSMAREIKAARRLGSYELGKRIAAGGMGEVWSAKHRLLRRPAAIKLIQPDRLNAENPAALEIAYRRFEREAQATAELDSPWSDSRQLSKRDPRFPRLASRKSFMKRCWRVATPHQTLDLARESHWGRAQVAPAPCQDHPLSGVRCGATATMTVSPRSASAHRRHPHPG